MNELVVVSWVLLINYQCWILKKSDNLTPILSIVIWFVIIIWYSIPGLLWLFINDYDKLSLFFESVEKIDFVLVFSIECSAVAIVLFFLSQTTSEHKVFQVGSFLDSNFNTKLIFKVFFGTILFQVYFINTNVNFDYLSLNSADNYGNSSVFQQLNFLVNNYFLSLASIIAIYHKDKKNILLAFVLIFVNSFLSFMGGGRFVILSVIFIFLIRLLVQKISLSAKKIYPFVIIGFIVLYVVMPLFTSIQDNRTNSAFDANQILKEASYRNDYQIFARVIFTKLDFFSTGYLLIQNENVGKGGLLPYVGSGLVFVPRSLFPQRPIAGSSDGTVYGLPSRVVPKTVNIVSEYLNVGVSPVCITLWQWGYIGYVIFIFASVLYLKFINLFLISPDITVQAIGISLFAIPIFHEIIASPDVLLRNVVLSMGGFLILFILRRLKITTSTSNVKI